MFNTGIYKLTVCLLLLSLAVPIHTMAQTTEEDEPYLMDTIEVIGESEDDLKFKEEMAPQGKTIITDDDIEALPSSNGDLNEYLKINSAIQFNDDYNSSNTGGEIVPAKVSISGGKSYQNNFVIDGVSNNSLLDPDATNPFHVDDVPGHPQKIFLDADLVESVDVIEDNIPVDYGGFMGGVVDAKTKIFEPDFKGFVKYRTTKDDWTHFYYENDEYASEDGFKNSTSHRKQPRFTKNEYGLNLNVPWSPDSGTLFHFQRHESFIGLKSFNKSKTQTRINENYFVKQTWLTSDGEFNLNLKHAPYEAKYFKADTKNGDIFIRGGGSTLSADYQTERNNKVWHIKTSYDIHSNHREAEDNYYHWKNTSSLNWGREVGSDYSDEGGFGSLKTGQSEFNIKGRLLWKSSGEIIDSNQLKIGCDFSRVTGYKERLSTSTHYSTAVVDPDVICNGNTEDCVEGEQYFVQKIVRTPFRNTASILRQAIYVEDDFTIGRFRFVPGIRYSYDDYMKNTNIAPRFSSSWDIRDNRNTILAVGANRYYGQGLLKFKLIENEPGWVKYTRSTFMNVVTDWSLSSHMQQSANRFSSLKTPYSDEFVIKLRQAIFDDAQLELKNTRRENRDEFSKRYGNIEADGLRYYETANDGESSIVSNSLKYTHDLGIVALYFHASRTEKESTASSYEDTMESADTRVRYGKKTIEKDELPHDKFPDPLRANLTITAKPTDNLKISLLTKFVDEQHTISKTGEYYDIPKSDRRTDPDTGLEIEESIPVYDDKKYNATIVADLKLVYRFRFFKRSLVTAVDIANLFDQKVPIVGNDNAYQRGRQFFAELKFEF